MNSRKGCNGLENTYKQRSKTVLRTKQDNEVVYTVVEKRISGSKKAIYPYQSSYLTSHKNRTGGEVQKIYIPKTGKDRLYWAVHKS